MKKLFAFVTVALMSVAMFAENITVAKAVEIGKKLEAGAETTEIYTVEGYVAKLYNDFNEEKKSQSFYMCDNESDVNPDSKDFEFEAFMCKLEKGVTPGALVTVTGKITNYVSSKGNQTIEIKEGEVKILKEGPAPVELEPITVAEALEIAQALKPEKKQTAKTSESYAVRGFVVGISSKNTNTFYLADEEGAYGEFEAYKCSSVDYEVAKGDLVIVTGLISHYWGEGSDGDYHSYEIANGKLKHVFPQGIENTAVTNKARKVMIDGVVYILRDGKMFDILGTQVR